MARGLALVGVGKIARDQHIPTLAASDDFDLVATASRNSEVGGVPSYRRLAELLAAAPGAECVSLCTPPQGRYDDARRAIEAGRHVMLEKPPGATLSEVHDLADRAAAAGVTLYATWHSRQGAAVDAARAWLRDRTVSRVRIDWKEDVRHWHPGQEWIWAAGGLGVFDPGINALSVLTSILPGGLRVTAAELRFPENRDTPIAADLSFADPSGAEISAAFDWLEPGPPTWEIRIETDAGAARLSEGGARFEAGGETVAAGGDDEYPRLYRRFAELIEVGESEVDLAPMRLVADAFLLGRRVAVAPFHW